MTQRRRSDSTADQLNTAMQQLLSQTFGRFAPDQAWSPNINIYQCAGRLVVCVDVAGVDRERLAVRLEPGRLEIRGERPAPDPASAETPCEPGERPLRILTMEIDDGSFSRSISLSDQVALDKVESVYRQGMLWITLPFDE
jgi:HSP20 family molecular chaperone IbpA